MPDWTIVRRIAGDELEGPIVQTILVRLITGIS
jgi:hypothetical protein